MADSILFLQDLAIILISATLAGALCRKFGLSPIVGYISAGLVIGTPEIIFPFVTDEERIKTIAQLGVVFLMFSIGLSFGFRRLRELGLRIVFSTLLTAFILLTAVRFSADLMGFGLAAGIAMAAIFMNSSSAIISKILMEKGISHQRHGQLAMGTTLLEDIVSVVMLTILGSFLVLEGGVETSLGPVATIGLLLGFALLILIFGHLLLPRGLRKLSDAGSSESGSVLVAGILLAIAIAAVYAGYSLALGAFLCGMIFADTREKAIIERTFRGLKDIFLTTFFVTIGMLVDISALPGALGWIVLGVMGAIFGRGLAAFVSFLVIGEHPRTAMQAALCVTPLGEFSFILAGVAVAGGLFGDGFQVVVVGTVLGTSLISPILVANSGSISAFMANEKWQFLDRFHQAYLSFWRSRAHAGKAPRLWPLLRKRIIQIGVELLMVSAVIFFAGRILLALKTSGPALFEVFTVQLLYWALIGILCSIPLIAIWRNLSAVAAILADYSTQAKGKGIFQKQTLTTLLKIIFGFLLLLWLWNILPPALPRLWAALIGLIVLLPLIGFLWKKLNKIHSELEWALEANVRKEATHEPRQLFEAKESVNWGLNLRDFEIPDGSIWAGKTLMQLNLRKRTGVSVVSLRRHGFTLTALGSTTHLFPGDEILLLGDEDQISQAIQVLALVEDKKAPRPQMESQILQVIELREGNPYIGKAIRELDWSLAFQIQIVAIRRDEQTITSPDAERILNLGDSLLLLGTAVQIDKLLGHSDLS